ncbi:nucleotidyltransferase domain-containing protein [Alistipes sp. OttesenSCG-928-B03]|nr:nucleotidyltransferase domain-containing protein [Alistipes sp. OttesenSCG-928-B03]
MRFGLTEETIGKIQSVFTRYAEIECVLIFGSRVKGNYKPASDIDLTIKGADIPHTTFNKILWELDDLLLPYTFDLSIYSKITNPEFLDHIDRIGQVFYSKEC